MIVSVVNASAGSQYYNIDQAHLEAGAFLLRGDPNDSLHVDPLLSIAISLKRLADYLARNAEPNRSPPLDYIADLIGQLR